jgi:hypothetical protein
MQISPTARVAPEGRRQPGLAQLRASVVWDPNDPSTWWAPPPARAHDLEYQLEYGSTGPRPDPFDAPFEVNRAGPELWRDLYGCRRQQILARLARPLIGADELAALWESLLNAPIPNETLADRYRGQAARFLESARASKLLGRITITLPRWPPGSASLEGRAAERRRPIETRHAPESNAP